MKRKGIGTFQGCGSTIDPHSLTAAEKEEARQRAVRAKQAACSHDQLYRYPEVRSLSTQWARCRKCGKEVQMPV